MKKYMSLFLIVIMISTLCSCSPKTESKACVAELENNCTIIVEPNLVLLDIIQYLSEDKINVCCDKDASDYHKIVDNYFSKYKQDEAVKRYKEVMKRSTPGDPTIFISYYVDDNLFLRKDIEIPINIINEIGGEQNIDEFLKSMKEFKKKTKFDKFYESQMKFYQKDISSFKNNIEKYGVITKLNNYYGYSPKSFTIKIQPFLGYCWGGILIPNSEELKATALVRQYGVSDGVASELLFHEFSHYFTDDLIYKNYNEIVKCKNLKPSSVDGTVNELYLTFRLYISDLITRAVTGRLIKSAYGDELYNAYINYHEKRGFVYVGEICKGLEEYENNRDKYPTFKEFYPRMLEILKEVSEKHSDVKK